MTAVLIVVSLASVIGTATPSGASRPGDLLAPAHRTADASASGKSASSTSTSTTSTTSTSTTTTAVGGGGGASTTTTAPAKGPIVLASGGTVTIAVPTLPPDLNPYTAQRATSEVAMIAPLIWPGVFAVGSGYTTSLQQDFVTNAEVIGVNPQRVEYQIDPRATWSDGVAITEQDFAYLWQEMRSAGSSLAPSALGAGYADISSISGTDRGRTVLVTFSKPFADWEGLFSSLIPAHVASRRGWATGFSPTQPSSLVSGGPFLVGAYHPGKLLLLVRNPRYWGTPAHLGAIAFKVVRGSKTVLSDLVSGSVDLAQLPPSRSMSAAVRSSGVLLSRSELTPELWQLDFNVADPTLADVRVREALAEVINRWELAWDTIGRQTNDVRISANRLFPSGFPGSIGGDSGFQQVNYISAGALLADAGYTMSPAGLLLSSSGVPLRLRLVGPSGSPLVAHLEQLLRAQLLSFGIGLAVTNVPLADLLGSLLPQGAYQIALAPYQLSTYPSANSAAYVDPVGPTLPGTASTGTAATGTTLAGLAPTPSIGSGTEPGVMAAGGVTADVNGFEDSEVSSLIEQAGEQLANPRSSGLYDAADARLWQDLPTLPLFQMPATLVWRVGIDNLSYSATPASFAWDAAQWGYQISPTPTVPTTAP